MFKLNRILFGFCFLLIFGCRETAKVPIITKEEQNFIVETATSYLDSLPVTVTAAVCERSAGGTHDFYSEGDYWWPDPANPDGPYIRKDGQTNPENFVKHRLAMIRLSQIVGRETSAYLLTGNKKFAEAAQKHLEAWYLPGNAGGSVCQINNRYYNNEKLQKFQRWLFGSSVNCAKEMAIFGDMRST
ncbi:MAG: alginate lyase family protein [Prolixibacteraceae bacterium]|nr:alginate lyase family protein [Prolixibacteraceae bacterium]